MGPKEILKVSAYRTITNPVPRLPLISIMDIPRVPYSGSSRKFILALDIGTTFSGAAYAFLDPGQVPQIQSVTRQALPPTPDPVTRRQITCRYLYGSNTGSAKVPSTFYYDRDGTFRGIVENGVNSPDSDSLLTMKRWEIVLSPPMQSTDSEVGGN